MEPKSILCFGDSNTWGMAPDGSGRLPFETRWPNLLQQILNQPPMIVLVTPGVIQTTPQSLAWGFKGATESPCCFPPFIATLRNKSRCSFSIYKQLLKPLPSTVFTSVAISSTPLQLDWQISSQRFHPETVLAARSGFHLRRLKCSERNWLEFRDAHTPTP